MTYEMPKEKVLESLEGYLDRRKDELDATSVDEEDENNGPSNKKLDSLKK